MVIAVFVFTLSDSTEYHFVCSPGSVCLISSIDFLNKEQFRWRSAFREENNLKTKRDGLFLKVYFSIDIFYYSKLILHFFFDFPFLNSEISRISLSQSNF